MDQKSFKSLVEGVNDVIRKGPQTEEINEKLLENCIASIDEQFLNEGIELTEEQLQELWAGLKAAAGHLMSGKLRGIRDVMDTAEQDANDRDTERRAGKKFDRAQKKAKDRADYLYNTGDSHEDDREYNELKAAATRRSEDLSHASERKRSADAPRLGGRARKDAEQTKADLSSERTARAAEQEEFARKNFANRLTRRQMRVKLAGKGDAKQKKHLERKARAARLDTRKYSAKGVHKETGKYVFGGRGVRDVMVDHVLNFARNVLKD
jgi:hypothetical protein